MTTLEKLTLIRKRMRDERVFACVVADSDPHNSEYPAAFYRRRSWLSGFTGSNGTLVVLPDRAGLWTDSRYFLEAEAALKGSGIELFRMEMPGVPLWEDWLVEHVSAGDCVARAADCTALSAWSSLAMRLEEKDARLVDKDLVVDIWQDRPELAFSSVWAVPEAEAGESVSSRLERVRSVIVEKGADAVLFAALDEIAWLLNVRAMDIDYNPLVCSFLVVREKDALFFVNPQRLSSDVADMLRACGVVFYDYYEFFDMLPELKGCLLADFSSVPAAIRQHISSDACLRHLPSPVRPAKAKKNPVEIANIREALLRDSLALVGFCIWLESAWEQDGALSEQEIADMLYKHRSRDERFVAHSFAPIVGFAGHGAIVHYNTLAAPVFKIQSDGLLLVDSGGHYRWGTTDITRVFVRGNPDKRAVSDYTAVLKAHIALARAVFVKGTKGVHLDILARGELARHGLSYGHGTGHGVGYLLSVHEGPCAIRTEGADAVLASGMLLSNEPGVYRQDKWGIRLENLVLVKELEENEFGRFLGFDTLTLFPFEPLLVDFSMLTSEEKKWLKDYHREVLDTLSQHLDKEEKTWLERKCSPFISL